jgi:hypothetical protein
VINIDGFLSFGVLAIESLSRFFEIFAQTKKRLLAKPKTRAHERQEKGVKAKRTSQVEIN